MIYHRMAFYNHKLLKTHIKIYLIMIFEIVGKSLWENWKTRSEESIPFQRGKRKKLELLSRIIGAVIHIVPFGKADFYEACYWKLGTRNQKLGKPVGRSAKVLPSCQSVSKSVRHLRRTLQTLTLSIDRKPLIMRMAFHISPNRQTQKDDTSSALSETRSQEPSSLRLALLLEAGVEENASQWNRFPSTSSQGRDLPAASLWVWAN